MAKRKPEIQVLIPYSQLVELLGASQQVEKLQGDVDSLKDQNSALRLQFTELMERLRQLT